MRTATSKPIKQQAKPSSKASIQKAAPQRAPQPKKVIVKATKTAQPSKAISAIPPELTALPITSKPNKQSQLIALLNQPQGSSLENLVKTLGWQSHSIRGIISGVLRKKLGLNVAHQKLNGACVYQILPKL